MCLSETTETHSNTDLQLRAQTTLTHTWSDSQHGKTPASDFNYDFRYNTAFFIHYSGIQTHSNGIVLCYLTHKLFSFVLGVMTADQIRPNQETSVMKEDETVTLSCTYETSSSNVRLYWYRQYLNEELHYLIYKGARSVSGGGSPDDPRFQSTTSHTSTELIITGVTLSDSALYYCALRVGAQWYKVYVKPYKNSNSFSPLMSSHIKPTI